MSMLRFQPPDFGDDSFYTDVLMAVVTLAVFGFAIWMFVRGPKQPHASTLEPERERKVWLQEHGR